jgi:hypothetical protein
MVFGHKPGPPQVPPVKDPDAEKSPTASRLNLGKRQFSIVPTLWRQILVDITMRGAEKYAVDNWKRSLNTAKHDEWVQVCLDCAERHIDAYKDGSKVDPESQLHTLGHAAWNLLAAVWYDLNDRRLKADVDRKPGEVTIVSDPQ